MDQVALCVLAKFENYRIEAVAYAADGAVLLGDVGPLVEPVGLGEQFLRFLESNSAAGVGAEALALSRVEAEAHLGYNCYTTPNSQLRAPGSVGICEGDGCECPFWL